jgi:hypothetical protein
VRRGSASKAARAVLVAGTPSFDAGRHLVVEQELIAAVAEIAARPAHHHDRRRFRLAARELRRAQVDRVARAQETASDRSGSSGCPTPRARTRSRSRILALNGPQVPSSPVTLRCAATAVRRSPVRPSIS